MDSNGITPPVSRSLASIAEHQISAGDFTPGQIGGRWVAKIPARVKAPHEPLVVRCRRRL